MDLNWSDPYLQLKHLRSRELEAKVLVHKGNQTHEFAGKLFRRVLLPLQSQHRPELLLEIVVSFEPGKVVEKASNFAAIKKKI